MNNIYRKCRGSKIVYSRRINSKTSKRNEKEYGTNKKEGTIIRETPIPNKIRYSSIIEVTIKEY
jgi:hypothetical protein